MIAPNFEYKISTFNTKGDQILNKSLSKIGDKGLFTEALEEAMRKHEIDFAVHSLKDIPTNLPDGLVLSGFTKRHDPSDAFLSRKANTIEELPHSAIIGTSSLRRIAQVKRKRPDIIIRDLRGNIQTRLEKYHQGDYDAIILASAGLIRLGMPERIKSFISVEDSLPAAGQGAVGIETRVNDTRVLNYLAKLNHNPTACCVMAERAMNTRLQGGCQVPIGGFATLNGEELELNALVGSLDGSTIIRASGKAHQRDAEQLGIRIAEQLLAQGADKILAEVYAE